MKSYRVWFILNWESIPGVIGIVEVRYVNILFLNLNLNLIFYLIFYNKYYYI